MGGSFAASISSITSPVAFGSAAAVPWPEEEEPPALACEACEACEAAVDPALAPSDIVANVLRVCVGTHLGVGEFSRQFPASVFGISPRFFSAACVCVCACEGSRCVCSLCCDQVAAMPYTRSTAMSAVI